ncbi:MAG TPA: P-II family nitrogen regulator [Steroidobacteraceae bacterium]
MKELKAYIREQRLNEVVRALRAAGATTVTVVKTVPVGAEVNPEYVDVSRAVPVEHFTPMLKLELVCDDRQADRYIDIIRDEARTGERGDGVVFVSSVEDAVRIRSGERGDRAL